MPHIELREYEYDDRPSERFDYDLRMVLNLVDSSRQNIGAILDCALAQPFDAVHHLSFAAGEATQAVGLLSPEVEFSLGSKFVAQFRALAGSERVLWEILNNRQLIEHRLAKSQNPVTKTMGKKLAQSRRDVEESLAIAAIHESFAVLLAKPDHEARRSEDVDELDRLLLSTSLNEPTDDLCALLEKADFSTTASTGPVMPASSTPKAKSAWQELADSVSLYKNEWVVTPPPNILLPGEKTLGNFCWWDATAPQHFSQIRRRPRRESSSVEDSRHFSPYSRKGRKAKTARQGALEKQLLFDPDLARLMGRGMPMPYLGF
ncbi:hypothetical protein AURDEDRAFT_188821 [Auricularia subglabra TFB-10046 SS5]|uniref:Uncharacterized protein n=1 Tax=Auricularia subglabra (strain TFB-10046 / SS5) TaxID=717982 RepID=J0D7T7_AURST|nr:hypothetical protein AURDEDRAFT_188821 [Auricularia subglabra TFB-10046 SS5]